MEAKEAVVVVEPDEQLAAELDEAAEAVSTLGDEDLLVVAGGPYIFN